MSNEREFSICPMKEIYYVGDEGEFFRRWPRDLHERDEERFSMCATNTFILFYLSNEMGIFYVNGGRGFFTWAASDLFMRLTKG